MEKPFSQSCENNQEPITSILLQEFNPAGLVLEIGSGTGQHSAWFHRHFKRWQCSDVKENLPGIKLWHQGLLPELPEAIEFNVNSTEAPAIEADYIFSANTVHIMSWPEVERFFQHIPKILKVGGKLALYGPFNYNGQFTSDSNARFNDWLIQQAPHRAIRDFEAVNQLARTAGLLLLNDYEMPANNRILVWQFIHKD